MFLSRPPHALPFSLILFIIVSLICINSWFRLEAPAQAGASSRPQPRSRRNSGTFSGFSHSAVVSSSRNEPQKPFHSPSKSTSENPMNAEMTRKLNKSTSAVGLSSSASKINFTQTPKIYIRPDQLKLSKNEDPEPSEFGTGKFQFSILGNVPLTPRWLVRSSLFFK